jgi:hypothetical protein
MSDVNMRDDGDMSEEEDDMFSDLPARSASVLPTSTHNDETNLFGDEEEEEEEEDFDEYEAFGSPDGPNLPNAPESQLFPRNPRSPLPPPSGLSSSSSSSSSSRSPATPPPEFDRVNNHNRAAVLGAGCEGEAFDMPPLTPVLDRIGDALQDVADAVEQEDMETATEELYARWVTYPRDHEARIVEVAYRLYGMERSFYTMVGVEDLAQRHRTASLPALCLYRRWMSEKYVTSDDRGSLVTNRFMRVLGMMFNARAMVQMDQNSRECLEPSLQVDGEVDIEKWAFKFIDTTDNTPYQNLLLYLLECACSCNYRKYASRMYAQILTEPSEDGEGRVHRTHAWKEVMDFPTFIFSNIQKESQFEQWQNFTSQRDLVRPLSEYMKHCRDPELRELIPDRHVFSFKNGIYNCFDDEFFEYGDQTNPIPSDLVAAKYFDLDFPKEFLEEDSHFHEIPTPHLDRVLDHQKISDIPHDLHPLPAEEEAALTDDERIERQKHMFSVKDWFYVFMGRMMYDIGEADEWQTIMFLKGVAGSGKSTIGKVLSYLYDPSDVGVLSNNLEKKFGLSSIADKKIYLCYEVKNDFGVDQGEFQSMISGEQMSIPVKFQTATSITWKSHGFLMGNEIANWVDNSGSVSRRIVIGDFAEKVTESDPQLFTKLQGEMAHFILKTNRAYLAAANLHGEKDIWKALPPYFHEQKRKLRASTHQLAAFFEFGECVRGEHCEWLFREFRQAANAYMKANQYKGTVNWDGDFKRAVFDEYGITEETREVNGVTRRWVIGVAPSEEGFEIPGMHE